jgi:NAD(P)-dependent dehydrogenase (short-subunit alcohol dehydrogenase family)
MSQTNPQEILVIGGSHGISFELVKLLAARGARVTCLSRTSGQLEAEGLLAGDQIRHVAFDVIADEVPTEQFPDQLDGFVYGPGSINLGPIKAAKAELMRQDFELNAVGAMRCFQASLPALKASGGASGGAGGGASAVFFSTVAVNHGIAMHSYVAAAKGAVQAMAKTWAAELAPKIRVNVVAPALTDTPLSAELLSSDKKRDMMAGKYPMRRVGQPTDIAEAADYLLSPRSSWMTGQVLGVDGGMSGIVPL